MYPSTSCVCPLSLTHLIAPTILVRVRSRDIRQDYYQWTGSSRYTTAQHSPHSLKNLILSFILVERKIVKPVAVGGQGELWYITFCIRLLSFFLAGGEKYIVQGIFFKFALGKWSNSLPPSLPFVCSLILPSLLLQIFLVFMEATNMPCTNCPPSLFFPPPSPKKSPTVLGNRKVASHELKGLLGYYGTGIEDLCLPMMVSHSWNTLLS